MRCFMSLAASFRTSVSSSSALYSIVILTFWKYFKNTQLFYLLVLFLMIYKLLFRVRHIQRLAIAWTDTFPARRTRNRSARQLPSRPSQHAEWDVCVVRSPRDRWPRTQFDNLCYSTRWLWNWFAVSRASTVDELQRPCSLLQSLCWPGICRPLETWTLWQRLDKSLCRSEWSRSVRVYQNHRLAVHLHTFK